MVKNCTGEKVTLTKNCNKDEKQIADSNNANIIQVFSELKVVNFVTECVLCHVSIISLSTSKTYKKEKIKCGLCFCWDLFI